MSGPSGTRRGPALLRSGQSEPTRLLRTYYAISFVQGLSFSLPVWVLFGHDYLHLSYSTAIALVILPDLIAAFLDIPLGGLADRFGRLRILRIGLALAVLTTSLRFVLFTDVVVLFAFVPFTAVSAALVSGILSSVVSAELHEHPDIFRAASARATSLGYLARFVASFAGGWMYVWDPRLPFAAGTAAYLVALILTWWLPRTSPTPTAAVSRAPVRQAWVMLRADGGMASVVLLALACWMLGGMLWTSYQPAMQQAGISPGLLGPIFAGLSLLSIAGSQLAGRLMASRSHGFLLRSIFAGVLVSAAAVGLSSGWYIVLATVPVQMAFGALAPLSQTYIGSRTPVHLKSTAFSVLSAVQVGFVASSVLAGTLLDNGGVEAVAWVVGLGSAAVLLAMPRRRLAGAVVPA